MLDEQRANFDESTKKFLACAICQNYYVVTLTKFKDVSMSSVDDGIFQNLKYEDLKGKIWLVNDLNEKRELAQFTPPKGSGDSAVFFFKRTDDKGAPLLTVEMVVRGVQQRSGEGADPERLEPAALRELLGAPAA